MSVNKPFFVSSVNNDCVKKMKTKLLWYKEVDGVPEPCSMQEGARYMDNPVRQVAETFVGSQRVSTVFLCLNHAYGIGPPVLYETMVFGGSKDQECWRYTTRSAALAGHERVVKELREKTSV